ncbi:MAG: EAL domain-containing protein [Rhizobiaceae bacterium]|nr:EAL domain-containing protein [Rhizobiaceae bacterium]
MRKLFQISNPKKLWRRYLVGLLLLLMMLLCGHGLHITIINSGANDAEIIDLSGRQRMLSQRISGLVLILSETPKQPLVAASLREAVTQFETAHDKLLIFAKDIPTVAEIYAEGSNIGLDKRSREFIDNVYAFLENIGNQGNTSFSVLQIQNAAFSSLLSQLDDAVKAFASDANARIGTLHDYQTFALVLAISLLVAEALLIFWPAHNSVVTSLDTAEEKAKQLSEQNSELTSLSQQLDHAANHDHLTGLANRKKLSSELARMLKERRENNTHLCVMHIDLDRFKEINDSLGHPVGDEVIRKTAENMKARVRKTDLVARVGGDEFVIVLNIDESHPVQAAHRIAEAIITRVKQPMVIDGNTCSIGASIGYIFASGANDNGDDLMANADIALYAAKNAGRGRAVFFHEKMRRDVEFRHTLGQDLQHAVADQEFFPFFQPKVSMKDGSLQGLEVLTRWQHPNRGILAPEEFLELAQETGIVEEIDQQAICKGLDALVKLRNDGWEVPSISINASGASLQSATFVYDLFAKVEKRGLKPSDVTVEVLETTLIANTDEATHATLRTLSEQGFKVEIDDFGTGYASLSTLANLKLSGLKIDQGLIENLHEPRSKVVVDTIIQLSQKMGLEVTAEGIETREQYTSLKATGCDYAQGFGIGMPMSIEDTKKWLTNYGRPVRDLAV